MTKEIEFEITACEEGGYEAKAVCHCICTQAETIRDLEDAIRDAVCCHFDEEETPETITLLVPGEKPRTL